MNRIGMGAIRVGGQAARSGAFQNVGKQAAKQAGNIGFRTVGQQAGAVSARGQSALSQVGKQFVRDTGETLYQDYAGSKLKGSDSQITKAIDMCGSMAMKKISDSFSNCSNVMSKEFSEM